MTNEFGLPRFFQEADFQKSRGKPHFPQVTTLTLEVLSWSYLQTQKAKDVSELRVGRARLAGFC
jgi:hypothetical protein